MQELIRGDGGGGSTDVRHTSVSSEEDVERGNSHWCVVVNRAAVNTHDGPSACQVDVPASRWQAACAPMLSNVGKVACLEVRQLPKSLLLCRSVARVWLRLYRGREQEWCAVGPSV